MSLLHRGTDQVTVFAEVLVTDSDGNIMTRPGTVGVECRAVVQPISATEETDGSGFHTESRYRLRLINYPTTLGAQAQVYWNGKRYVVDGDAMIYNGSPRTAHVDYVMVRK